MNLSPGTVLKERYEIERELGRGGLGVVFLARDRGLMSRPVVVKVLHGLAAGGDYSWALRKFGHEIEALARIDHPGIVGVMDTGSLADGSPFFVMQYVDGQTLRAMLGGGTLPLARVARIVRQIGQALGAAHERGILHRDLKPDNVMVQVRGDDEFVKLIDFGLASLADPTKVGEGVRTSAAGTVSYMAPEQLMGNVLPAADVFAFGVIAYEMVTGRQPFEVSSPYLLLDAQRKGLAVTPRQVRPDLPPAAEKAILRALAFAPEERYARPRDFAEAFASAIESDSGASHATTVVGIDARGTRAAPAAVASGAPVAPTTPMGGAAHAADPTGPVTTPEPPRPRRSPAGALAAAIGLLAAVALAAVLVAWPRPQPARVDPPPPPIEFPSRSLTYSITVQKYRDERPYQEPFQLGGEVVFEKDYRVRLNLASAESGALYVLNESPPDRSGAIAWRVLYPSPIDQQSAAMPAGWSIQLPAGAWFRLDEAAGTEKIWVVWAAEEVPEFAAVSALANRNRRSLIEDQATLGPAVAFLKSADPGSVRVERDQQRRETTLRGDARALVHLIPLEHH